jgi:hypothetical protein
VIGKPSGSCVRRDQHLGVELRQQQYDQTPRFHRRHVRHVQRGGCPCWSDVRRHRDLGSQFRFRYGEPAEYRRRSGWSSWPARSDRRNRSTGAALHYLGCYTHRVAISNHRLVSLANGRISFRWRDSAHKNKKRIMSLTVEEFLRRFLLHVLPRGFVRIRYFGFFSHRRRTETVPLCFELLATAASLPRSACVAAPLRPMWQCPKCGGPMVVLERLTPVQLRLRSPPVPVTRQA